MEAVVIGICSKENPYNIAVLFSNKRKKWELPGGKIEEGETIEQAAIRETKEETGLNILNFHYVDYKHDGEMISHMFIVDEYEGELQSSDEGNVMWMEIDRFFNKVRSFPEYSQWAIENILKEKMIFPKEININEYNREYLQEVTNFAKSNPIIGITLFQSFDRLAQIAKNYNTIVNLYKDWAPYSFEFSISNVINGGIIYHGSHDGFGNGGAPTFSVSLTPINGWSIHT